MAIHQVLRRPRGALRLDPKQTAVATTLNAREASPHLPPLPFRNRGFVLAVLLSGVESSGQGHIGVLSISFNFQYFSTLSEHTKNKTMEYSGGCDTFLLPV